MNCNSTLLMKGKLGQQSLTVSDCIINFGLVTESLELCYYLLKSNLIDPFYKHLLLFAM